MVENTIWLSIPNVRRDSILPVLPHAIEIILLGKIVLPIFVHSAPTQEHSKEEFPPYAELVTENLKISIGFSASALIIMALVSVDFCLQFLSQFRAVQDLQRACFPLVRGIPVSWMTCKSGTIIRIDACSSRRRSPSVSIRQEPISDDGSWHSCKEIEPCPTHANPIQTVPTCRRICRPYRKRSRNP